MNICVFGSSSENIDREFLDTAESLGRELAKKGNGVVFGAGKYGVMGATARGVVAENGTLIGVSPKFFIEMDVLEENCTELIYTETMRERKGIMEDKSDAFIICAGGMGTFEEFFEVLTLKQLRRHSKPIIVYNVKGYYDPLIAMLDNAVKNGFMTEDCNLLYTVAKTEQEVFDQLENYVPFSYNKYDYLEQNGEDKNG
ncbi:MAG: TIGR00730 family Rossman fold protein [Ruminococcus sp.]|nr:TIGR00730 family Rossman fold protein [Ruminococcus sp.]